MSEWSGVRAFDAHDAVLLGAMEECVGLELLALAGPRLVPLHPTDVLATPETPTLQTLTATRRPCKQTTPLILWWTNRSIDSAYRKLNG